MTRNSSIYLIKHLTLADMSSYFGKWRFEKKPLLLISNLEFVRESSRHGISLLCSNALR